MISRPPEQTGPGASTGGARRTSRIVRRSLGVAYRDLQLLARDHRRPRILRALARATCVLLHRVLLLLETGADRDVDAEVYLADTLDTAARTSLALIDQEATR